MSIMPPPLTNSQKKKLREFEPQLRACVKTGDFENAKSIAVKIQNLLKPTGHTVRWLQNLNWVCEAAIEAGKLSFAEQRLESVRKIMDEGTRTYLEATALLAICKLRQNDIINAKRYIREAIDNMNNIKTDGRRRQFHKRLISRIEDECILAGMKGQDDVEYNVDDIQEEAIKLLVLDEKSLIIHLGNSIPSQSVLLLENLRNHTINLLPPVDRKYLPPPSQTEIPKELGKRASTALKRITWGAICDPNDDVHKAWSNGLSVVYDKKWITGAVVAACKSWKITAGMVVTAIVALAFKMGVNVFCDVFAPESIMIGLREKDK